MTDQPQPLADPAPGYRIIGGGLHCFNLEIALDHAALEAKRLAPRDLRKLSDLALETLAIKARRIWAMSKGTDSDLSDRAEAEKARRAKLDVSR